MSSRKVLVTGASGYIAAQLLPALRERYELTLVDVRTEDRHGQPVDGIQVADLTNPDLEANRALFRGIDTVVHLGYIHPPVDERQVVTLPQQREQLRRDVAGSAGQQDMPFRHGTLLSPP